MVLVFDFVSYLRFMTNILLAKNQLLKVLFEILFVVIKNVGCKRHSWGIDIY